MTNMPNEHEPKVLPIVEKWQQPALATGVKGLAWVAMVAELEHLLAVESKSAVTSALAECAESLMKKYHADFQIGVCRAYELISNFLPSPNYIALREADARIDEYRANEAAYSASLYVHGPGDVRTNFEKWRMWKEQHVAALTETRDRIAKGKQ